MKLLNYTSAGMVVLTILFLIAQGIAMLGKHIDFPFGWAPILTLVVLLSAGTYHGSRLWIERRDRPGVRE